MTQEKWNSIIWFTAYNMRNAIQLITVIERTQVSNPFWKSCLWHNPMALVSVWVSFFGCQIVKSLIPPDTSHLHLSLSVCFCVWRACMLQRSRNKINSRQTWLKQAALSMRRARERCCISYQFNVRSLSSSPGLHLEVDIRRKQTGKRCALTHNNTRSHTLFCTPREREKSWFQNHCKKKIKVHKIKSLIAVDANILFLRMF